MSHDQMLFSDWLKQMSGHLVTCPYKMEVSNIFEFLFLQISVIYIHKINLKSHIF